MDRFRAEDIEVLKKLPITDEALDELVKQLVIQKEKENVDNNIYAENKEDESKENDEEKEE